MVSRSKNATKSSSRTAAAGWVAATGLLLALAGCGEDFLRPGDETLIEGTAVVDVSIDPREPPVDNLGLGLLYHLADAAPGTILPAAQADGLSLRAPYPNPLPAPDVTPLTVIVEADQATPARVEIWAELRFFAEAVVVLEDASLDAGTNTYTWNGAEGGVGERVPNGLYYVRVTPADGGGTIEAPVVLNRPVGDVIALESYNEFTGFDGSFLLVDIAVGAAFARTGSSGASLGTAVLQNRVTLFACDIDFQHQEELVRIAPRERVALKLSLVPRISAAPVLSNPRPLADRRSPVPAF
jgi:hypothetical protein